MQYKEFKDGIKLSKLGMGNMRLPEKEENGIKTIDYEAGKAIIDLAYKEGINYYDTAYIYHGGKSEWFIGEALKDYPRDSYYIADKFNFQAEPDYAKQFEEQLERLQMDRIDFYLLHGIQDNFVDDILSCGCIEYFDQLKKAGKIRYLGFSFHGNEENLLKTLEVYPWDFVQIQLNYYDWEYGNHKRLYEILKERNIPVMVMEPVHGGLLATLNESSAKLLKENDPEASLASWAMRWVNSLDQVQVTLSGMSTLEQMMDNVNTFSDSRQFTEREKDLVKEAAELLRKDVSFPCTACRYCVPNCPIGLNIPDLLRAYNEMKTGGEWRLINLFGLPEEKRPSACIGCYSCTAHCPQALEIPKAMREMSEILENMSKRTE